jgi:hypothetical protein
MLESSWVVEQLVASREVFSSTELVNKFNAQLDEIDYLDE